MVTTKTTLVKTTSSLISSIQNPKIALIAPIDKQILAIREQKTQKDNSLLILRSTIENEIKSKVGFLDELNVMYSLLSDSTPALIVWLIWFFFLLGLEAFILISKVGDKENDYDATILHQMNFQLKKLALLAKNGNLD